MRRSLLLISLATITAAAGLAVTAASRATPTAVARVPCAQLKRQHRRLPRRCKKPPAPRPTLPPGAEIVATMPLGDPVDPIWIAADATAVWVHGSDHVARIDPTTNTVAARVPTPQIGYGYMASGAGAVWQTDFGDNTLLRVDPMTNRLVATIPLGDDAAPEGVGVAAGSVWVASHHLGEVFRVDPATNTIVAAIKIGATGSSGPLELAAGATGVWVNVPNAGGVFQIDPATDKVVGAAVEGGPPILDGDQVWIETADSIDRIDPTTHKMLASVRTPLTTGWGAAGFGSIWVTTKSGLIRVNEATNKVVGLLKTVPNGDIATTAGSVWVAAYGKGQLLRLSPAG